MAVQPSDMHAIQPHSSGRGRWRNRLAVLWRGQVTNWSIFASNRLAVAGVILIGVFGLMSISHPILRATVWQEIYYDPVTGFDFRIFEHPSPPSSTHLLGTDSLGRDVLSMLLAGTQAAFTVGLVAAVTTAVISLALGTLAAYYRGVVDAVFNHVADMLLLMPAPLVMIVIGMRFNDVVGPAPLGFIYGVLAGAGGAAIVIRAQALTVLTRPFIQAARVSGGGALRIMVVHLLPHLVPLAALYMMLSVTGAVVADGFISFFGFTRTYLNWGTIIYSSFVYSGVFGSNVEWNVLIPPSMALSLFAAAFYFVSRGLHAVADPRQREQPHRSGAKA